MSAYDIKRGGMHLSDAPGVPPVVCVPASELRALRAHSVVLLRFMRSPGDFTAYLTPAAIEELRAAIDEELDRPEPGPVPPYATEGLP